MQQVSDNLNQLNFYPSLYKQTFKGTHKDESGSAVDAFIKEVDDENKRLRDGNFVSKYMWSNTAWSAALVPIVVYEIATMVKVRQLEKAGNKAQVKQLAKKFLKNLAWLSPMCIIIPLFLQYIFSKNTDKNFEKVKKQFDEINTNTSASLDEELFSSGYIGGLYYPSSNKIKVNKNYVNDPISRLGLKKTLKHELVHAEQSELIVRSEDGIKKLNYATMKNLANTIKRNPDFIKQLDDLYEEIQQDTEGKTDNQYFKLYAINFNLKKFVNALHILIHNENATYEDIPMCIDENHYKSVVKEKGPLTAEEKIKADEYYKGVLEYSAPENFIDAYSSSSKYRKNTLEKEAYKAGSH